MIRPRGPRARRAAASPLGLVAAAVRRLPAVLDQLRGQPAARTGVADRRSATSWAAPAAGARATRRDRAAAGGLRRGRSPSCTSPASASDWRPGRRGRRPRRTSARGVGHYPDTALPGQVGNFAVAGHRATYGEPFAQPRPAAAGRRRRRRDRSRWFTYRRRPHRRSSRPAPRRVIDPVPGQARRRRRRERLHDADHLPPAVGVVPSGSIVFGRAARQLEPIRTAGPAAAARGGR